MQVRTEITEDQLQAQLFKEVWNKYPETRRCFFAIPNGGTRNVLEAQKFKATGLIAGEPDMILLHGGKCYGFELKTSTGRLSPAQFTCHKAWKEQGIDVFIIRTLNDGLALVRAIIEGRDASLYRFLLSVA